MSAQPPESSIELIEHVFQVLLKVLRDPANADLIPYALEGCSAVVDLMEDRLEPGHAAILHGALARREKAEGHMVGGVLESALQELDEHSAHFPHDDSARGERARVARALILHPGG